MSRQTQVMIGIIALILLILWLLTGCTGQSWNNRNVEVTSCYNLYVTTHCKTKLNGRTIAKASWRYRTAP